MAMELIPHRNRWFSQLDTSIYSVFSVFFPIFFYDVRIIFPARHLHLWRISSHISSECTRCLSPRHHISSCQRPCGHQRLPQPLSLASLASLAVGWAARCRQEVLAVLEGDTWDTATDCWGAPQTSWGSGEQFSEGINLYKSRISWNCILNI